MIDKEVVPTKSKNWGGPRPGSGHPKSKKTQLKDWEKAHPNAYNELMDMLYAMAADGNLEAVKYALDRLKGRPKQEIDARFTALIGVVQGDDIARLVLEEARLANTKMIEEYSVIETTVIEGDNDVPTWVETDPEPMERDKGET